nr:hypothetical protein [Tanacetum cinerariifolium]
MQKVRAMHKQQLIEEYEYICKRLENDRLLSAQHSLFPPKPEITKPSAKRQRVEEPSSQPATVFATSVSATAVFAAPRFTDSTIITTAAMDSAIIRRKVGVSPFADSAADALPFFSSIAGGPTPSNEFFLDSDEEMPPGVSRVAAEPDFDDEVVAEILFRGQSICDADDGLDLWRDVNMLCRSLHADDVEEFWHDQNDWIMSSWTLYTKSIVHVLDLTNGKNV